MTLLQFQPKTVGLSVRTCTDHEEAAARIPGYEQQSTKVWQPQRDLLQAAEIYALMFGILLVPTSTQLCALIPRITEVIHDPIHFVLLWTQASPDVVEPRTNRHCLNSLQCGFPKSHIMAQLCRAEGPAQEHSHPTHPLYRASHKDMHRCSYRFTGQY